MGAVDQDDHDDGVLDPFEGYPALVAALGYAFAEPQLLLKALTHRSWANEQGAGSSSGHNERLEFLGDAVVDLSVGHYLMERLPDIREGELSKLRARIVSETTLVRASLQLGLDQCVRLGRGEAQSGGRQKPSILADAFEAVIGAVFLDGGYSVADTVVRTQLDSLITDAVSGRLGQDYKTRLQELSQSGFGQRPRYEITGQSGPDHARTFSVSVSVDGRALAQASGRSKKEAEQQAAQQALSVLRKLIEQER